MNGFMAPEKEKTPEERRKEEEAKIKEEEEKKIQEAERMKHNYVIRMTDSSSKLETDDLDDDELKILKEVSRKGYYHARPQTQVSNAPQKLENPEALEWKKVSFNRTQKRSLFAKKEPAAGNDSQSKVGAAGISSAKKDESREPLGNDGQSKVGAGEILSESRPKDVASSTSRQSEAVEQVEVPPASKAPAETSQRLHAKLEKRGTGVEEPAPWFLQCCRRRQKWQ